MIDWMGFKKCFVEFEAPDRHSGKSTYSYPSLIKTAVASFVSFSKSPLYIISFIGLSIMFLSFLSLVWMTYGWLVGSIYTPLAIAVVANSFFSGLILMALSFVALYIGKIHSEVIKRPLYIIKKKINLD